MKAYFEGRELSKYEDIGNIEIISDKYFVNNRVDNTKIENRKFENSTFATMGFKSNRFNSCQFMYCIFLNCYFKDAKFDNTKFIGCKFIECNFEGSTYYNCDFRYASFKECFIQFKALYNTLPNEENIRWRICKNLARECLSLGYTEDYREYYFEEKKATEKQNIEIILRRQSYYKNKYGGWEAIVNLVKLIISKLDKYLWGYGENLKNLIINVLVVVFGFAVLYNQAGTVFKINGDADLINLNFADSFYLSICNFITITADITTANSFIRNSTVIEGVVGVILTGFFVAALFRHINRR